MPQLKPEVVKPKSDQSAPCAHETFRKASTSTVRPRQERRMQQAEDGDGSATGDIAALIEAVEVWRVGLI